MRSQCRACFPRALGTLCITAGQIYIFMSYHVAEKNKMIISTRQKSVFQKKKKGGSFRLIAKLENCAYSLQLGDRSPLHPGEISPHYIFSFHSYLWQLGTKSSSPVPLVLTFLYAKEPSFPNSLNDTCLFGGKEIWKWIWICFTTTSPIKMAKSWK